MYVFKFDSVTEAAEGSSLIPKLKDDLLARVLSIFFAIYAILDFIQLVYSWSWYEWRIRYCAIMIIECMCMCYLASGVVKGRTAHIFVAAICEALMVCYYVFWFAIAFLGFLGFDFTYWGYFAWYWFLVYVLWVLIKILLMFLIWRLYKGIRGGGLMQPLSSSSQPESS